MATSGRVRAEFVPSLSQASAVSSARARARAHAHDDNVSAATSRPVRTTPLCRRFRRISRGGQIRLLRYVAPGARRRARKRWSTGFKPATYASCNSSRFCPLVHGVPCGLRLATHGVKGRRPARPGTLMCGCHRRIGVPPGRPPRPGRLGAVRTRSHRCFPLENIGGRHRLDKLDTVRNTS